MREAAELVRERRFDDARTLLEDAYNRSPDPALLFSRAQVERIAGNCDAARELFEEFAAQSAPKDAKLARQLGEQCEEILPPVAEAPVETPDAPPDEEPKPPTSEPVVTPEPEPEPEPIQAPYDPPSLVRRPLPIVFLVTGLVATGTGVGLLGSAQANPPTPGDVANEGEYGERIRSHEVRTNMGIGFTVVGVGLLAAATTTWIVLARRYKRDRLSADAGGLRVSF